MTIKIVTQIATIYAKSTAPYIIERGMASSISIKNKAARTPYAVVARGEHLVFYANGDRLSGIVNDKLSEGRIAYSVSQQSGETTCVFNNGWIWALKLMFVKPHEAGDCALRGGYSPQNCVTSSLELVLEIYPEFCYPTIGCGEMSGIGTQCIADNFHL